MAGNRTSRQFAHGVERVSSAGRTDWQHSVLEIWKQILRGWNCLRRFIFFQSPLLFGGINLAEIVDAGVALARLRFRLLGRRQLLQLLLLLLGEGAGGLQLLG